MGGVVAGITDSIGLTDTKDAGDQAALAAKRQAEGIREGSQLSADAQREALAYMKEREALPQQYREEALTGLAGYYQAPGQPMGQEAMIDQAQQSPLYQSLVSGGEEAALAQASATGGLRSGNIKDALAQNQNRALMASFNQAQQREDYNTQTHLGGLQSLANIQSNAPMIAGQMSGIGQTMGSGAMGIGQTMAQGRVAQAQANIAAENQLWDDVTGMAKMAMPSPI